MERILVDEKTGNRYLLKSLSEVTTEKKLKVAFIPGHHSASMGDWSHILKKHEWSFWAAWVHTYMPDVCRRVGVEGVVIQHDPTINSYIERQKKTAEQVREAGCDLALEFHWNSFDPDNDGDDDASGCEALVCEINTPVTVAAEHWAIVLNNILKYKNRGLKLLDSNSNGYGFLSSMPCPAILLEWFFADSEDAVKFTNEAGIESLILLINKFKKLTQ